MNYQNPNKGIRFAGSKGRCRRMIRTIQSYVNPDGMFVDLFCGAGKIIQSINCKYRVANDLDPYIVSLLVSIRDGWDPPRIVTEETYQKYMGLRGGHYEDPMMAFVGYGCSFGARFFQGYARSRKESVNFAASARSSLLRQKPFLQGIEFSIADYRQCWSKFDPYWDNRTVVIYCDIPYKGTKLVGSAVSTPFDYERFWKWAWHRSKEGNIVLVSEYSIPKSMRDRVKVVWEQSVAAGIRSGTKGYGGAKGSGKRKAEKLYLIGNPKDRPRAGLGLI